MLMQVRLVKREFCENVAYYGGNFVKIYIEMSGIL